MGVVRTAPFPISLQWDRGLFKQPPFLFLYNGIGGCSNSPLSDRRILMWWSFSINAQPTVNCMLEQHFYVGGYRRVGWQSPSCALTEKEHPHVMVLFPSCTAYMNLNIESSLWLLCRGLQEGWLTVPKLRINRNGASTCDGPFPLMHNFGYIEPNILWNPTLKCQFQMKVTVLSFAPMKRCIPVMPLLVTCGGPGPGRLLHFGCIFWRDLAPIISQVTIKSLLSN